MFPIIKEIMFTVENSETTDQKRIEITHNPTNPRRELKQDVFDRATDLFNPFPPHLHTSSTRESFLYHLLLR